MRVRVKLIKKRKPAPANADKSAGPIKIKPSHEGDYRAHTGTPEGEEIPQSTIDKDLNSDDAHVRQMANFANNARKWKK